MECELAQQKIALFAYGELPDDQCHALEGHLIACKHCQEEFAAVQALQQAMALAPAQEPSANLLAQARLRLEEALDSMPRTSWLMRVQQSLFRGVSMLGRAPLAASALLVLGIGSGGGLATKLHLRSHRLPIPGRNCGTRNDRQCQQHYPRTKYRECRSTFQSAGSGDHPRIAR